MKIKSIKSKGTGTVKKPRPDFPLTPHPSGRWCKKVRGRLHYFGRLDDPQAALDKWLDQKDDLLAGRTPRMAGDELTIRDLCNRFCTLKKSQVETSEIGQRHFDDIFRDCALIVAQFGKTRLVTDLVPHDFEAFRVDLSKRLGAVALGNTIQRIRSVFKYAFDSNLIPQPVRCGESFNKPKKSVVRRERAETGERLFDANDLRQIIALARPALKAMILLGVNCGLENSSCGKLQFRHLDLDGGWLNFPRPKTGIARRCYLWPETVKALRAAIAKRPEPKDEAHANLVFITKRGLSWGKSGMANPISHQFRSLLVELKLYRLGLSFYTLRHQFETIGGGCRDQVAVNAIMGHTDASMAATYREQIEDDRLVTVAEHVRKWLFPKKPKAK
jgi:integrase